MQFLAKSNRLFATALLLAVSSCSSGKPQDQSRWIYIGHAQGWMLYLDTKQIDRNSGLVKVWVREAQMVRANSSGRLPEKKRLMAFDCQAMTQQQLMVISYDADGNVLSKDGRLTAVRPVVPDTFGENFTDALCHGERGLREARELSYQAHSDQPLLSKVRAQWH